MRIHRIHIDGFGRFADRSLGPFDRLVTIFHGLNEAGKSTLLEFIRRLLFGFPDGRSSQNPYPPLAGGRHGGQMTVIDQAGKRYAVRRYQGSKGGPVTITGGRGETLAPTTLEQLLGHHSRDIFQNIFAFTLDDLHSEKLLSDDRVNSQIYSAGMGAAKLPNALKVLNEDKDKLFLKGGSKHAIYDAASKLDEIDSSLGAVADHAADYGRLTGELEEVEMSLQERNSKRRSCQKQLDRQKQLANAWSDWNDLNEVERQLSELSVIDDFPVNGVNRLETMEERIRTAHREWESAGRDVTEAEAKSAAPVEHETILDRSADIRKLEQGRTSFDSSDRDLPKRKTELERYESDLAVTLKDLGADWDKSRLENFDLSLVVREEISQYQERLREGREEIDRCKSTLNQDETALQEAVEAENTAQREIDSAASPELDAGQIKQRRNLIRAARYRLAEIDRRREEISNLQSQIDSLENISPPRGGPGGTRMVAAIALVAGIAFLTAGSILGGSVLPVGITAGIVLIGIAACLFFLGRPFRGEQAESPIAASLRKSRSKAKAKLERLQSTLEQEAAPLGLETIDETSLIAAEGSLDDQQERIRQWDRLSEAFGSAKNLTEQRKSRVERSREAVEEAKRALESVEAEWRQWLADRGLRETFLPETAGELRGKVESGLNQLRDLKSQRQRIDAIQKDIDDYVAIAAPLASNFGVALNRNDLRSVAAAAENLVDLHGDVQEKSRRRTAAQTDLEEAKRRLQERESSLQKTKDEMKSLLQSGAAADTEDFRKRGETYRRRVELEEKKRDIRARLQRLSGPGEQFESLLKTLRETDLQAIEHEALRVEEERGAVDAQIESLSAKRGSIQSDLRNLTGEEESSKLRADRQRLLQEMRGHAREWAVLTIAENLLNEARRKFEKERQPEVVRSAASFFKDITEGRYEKVFSPLGKSEIHVTDSTGNAKQPSELSRGTREQLFLSLRFGLVRDLGRRAEPLPVIVDEALVNFDPRRGLRAASAFVDLAQTNQVLVFTCHRQIVDWFVSAASERGAQEPEVIPIE